MKQLDKSYSCYEAPTTYCLVLATLQLPNIAATMLFKTFTALASIATVVTCSHVTAPGPDVTYDAGKTKSLGGTTCLPKIDDCTTWWSTYTYASTATVADPNHTVTRVWTTSTPVVIPASDAPSTATETLPDPCSTVTSVPLSQSISEGTMTTLEVEAATPRTTAEEPPATMRKVWRIHTPIYCFAYSWLLLRDIDMRTLYRYRPRLEERRPAFI
ncbi:hypothetical protein F4775DRAFT_548415 [Biscogniauxia sp. FL1348]|nr:hypothetical protein F4775DRAFT_548415 [Biscogniauxia sp. FL1348]